MRELNASLNVRSKILKLDGEIFHLSDEFVDGDIENIIGSEEIVLDMRYREQIGDKGGTVQDDAENIYLYLEERELCEFYSVCPNYVPMRDEKDRYVPHIALYGDGLRPMIDRSGCNGR
jgi:hypothetical protein